MCINTLDAARVSGGALPEPTAGMSRVQARIVLQEDGTHVLESASLCGTYVNNKRIDPGSAPLRHGDIIVFGGVGTRVERGGMLPDTERTPAFAYRYMVEGERAAARDGDAPGPADAATETAAVGVADSIDGARAKGGTSNKHLLDDGGAQGSLPLPSSQRVEAPQPIDAGGATPCGERAKQPMATEAEELDGDGQKQQQTERAHQGGGEPRMVNDKTRCDEDDGPGLVGEQRHASHGDQVGEPETGALPDVLPAQDASGTGAMAGGAPTLPSQPSQPSQRPQTRMGPPTALVAEAQLPFDEDEYALGGPITRSAVAEAVLSGDSLAQLRKVLNIPEPTAAQRAKRRRVSAATDPASLAPPKSAGQE